MVLFAQLHALGLVIHSSICHRASLICVALVFRADKWSKVYHKIFIEKCFDSIGVHANCCCRSFGALYFHLSHSSVCCWLLDCWIFFSSHIPLVPLPFVSKLFEFEPVYRFASFLFGYQGKLHIFSFGCCSARVSYSWFNHFSGNDFSATGNEVLLTERVRERKRVRWSITKILLSWL